MKYPYVLLSAEIFLFFQWRKSVSYLDRSLSSPLTLRRVLYTLQNTSVQPLSKRVCLPREFINSGYHLGIRESSGDRGNLVAEKVSWLLLRLQSCRGNLLITADAVKALQQELLTSTQNGDN